MSEYEFKKGSAFMRPPTEKEDDHLHIILTNPMLHGKGRKQKVKVIMVNTTSIKGRYDKTYLVDSNDHEDITIESYIYYKEAELISIVTLQKELKQGKIKLSKDFDSKKVQEIAKGLKKSKRTPKPIKDFYREYLLYNESRKKSVARIKRVSSMKIPDGEFKDIWEKEDMWEKDIWD